MRQKSRLTWALLPKTENQARKVRPADRWPLPAPRPAGLRRRQQLLAGLRAGWLGQGYQWVAAAVTRHSPPR